MGERQIAVAVRHRACIGGVGKAHFLGEGVAVQPVDQPFAPRGDDGGLRVMHMGVDEARRDEMAAVIGDLCGGMGGFQRICFADGADTACLDQHGAMGDMARGFWPHSKGIRGEGQDLSQNQIGHDAPVQSACANRSTLEA